MPHGSKLERGEGGPPTPAPSQSIMGSPSHWPVPFHVTLFFSIKPEDRAPAESSDHFLAARTGGPPITRTTAV